MLTRDDVTPTLAVVPVSGLAIFAVVYLAVWLAAPTSASIQHELIRQVKENTELHTAAKIARETIQNNERIIGARQAVLLSRLESAETAIASLRSELATAKHDRP